MPSPLNRKRVCELQHTIEQRQRKLQLELADIDLVNLSQRLFEQKLRSRRRVSLSEANQVKQNLAKNIRHYLERGQLKAEQVLIADEILSLCSKRTTAINLIDIYRKTCVLKH